MSVEKNVPEIRFKGFSGEWNNLALGENAIFTKGQGYSKGDLVSCGSPIILYGRLYTRYQTVINCVDTFVNEKTKPLKSIGGEVLVPASGESPEDISRASVVNEPNVILGGDLNVIYPNKKIDPVFLALAISNGHLKKELSSKAQGKSVVHIRNSDLADLNITLPCDKEEQTRIGNIFQKLDNLINQHQQQHDKLNSIKNSMLEKMFPKQGETIPEIRFKGFSGEWEEHLLGDKMTVTSVKRILQSDWTTSGVRFLRARDIVSSYKNEEPADYLYIAREKYEQYSQLSVVTPTY
ncbi:restriction endonuclease subunit S [Plesiomonas shigelloides]|uniref:restriction endonuclease subunit S n=1 Tax=Plesiomonas shigelloides TaxID=703 RepID=UPI0015AD40D6|nr:restriction endonuclease subunit S [Plesiomonas shigelloides]